ncbi:MAG TPA: hypothetical protein VEV17_12740 [Bryobacteraceae bacterium]|nr:hypothetical protein [Bryobacteraceae bacterium]
MPLVDQSTHQIINTVRIHSLGAHDTFITPFRILPDFYYSVPGRRKGTKGKPRLLDLRDINGDGLPLEAAFFEAVACMGLDTTLVVYSPKQDRVIQFPVKLSVQAGKKPTTETTFWIDYLFSRKPVEPGHWTYQIDYRGRGGSLDKYDIRFDAEHEQFVGTLTRIPP